MKSAESRKVPVQSANVFSQRDLDGKPYRWPLVDVNDEDREKTRDVTHSNRPTEVY